MTAIPLRYRLPNPPPICVGREAEAAWLEAAIARAPVTFVVGPVGIGKSALVRHVLHRRTSLGDRSAFLELPPGEPNQQTRHEILRMLRALVGVGENAAFPANDPEAATAAALDLAESASAVIVIDRDDPAADPEFREMMVMLARFARASRWIVTSPHAIAEAELAGQTLPLGALSLEATRELALAWAPSLDNTARAIAVERASGSPFFLRQWLSGAPVDRENGLLVGLSDRAVTILKSMVAIEGPLSREAAKIVVPEGADDAIAELERRGLARPGPEGVIVHGVVRGLVELGREDIARIRSQAAALVAHAQTPGEVIESLRLVVSTGDVTLAQELLEANAAELLRSGYAPALFRILTAAADPRLDSFRVRCAAELGNPTALGSVEGAEVDRGDRLAWAHALFARGALEDAAKEAEALLDRAGGRERASAALLLSETLQLLGHMRESLVPLGFAGDHLRARVLALRAAAFGLEGDAGARTDELERTALADGDEHALLLLAEALWAIGRPRNALYALRRIGESPRGEADHLIARRAKVLEARIALDAADPRPALEVIASLERYARGASILRPMLEALREDAGALRGDGSSTPGGIAASKRRYRAAAAPIEVHATELESAERCSWERATSARRGAAIEPAPAKHPRLLVIERLGTAAAALARGDLSSAVEAVREGVAVADRAALFDAGAELLALSIDAFLCARDLEKGRQTLGALAALGERTDSAALRGDLRFYQAVLAGELDVASIESIAIGSDRAARRARALLGSKLTPLDGVDERVIAAVRETHGVEIATLGESDGWGPGFGIDLARSSVSIGGASIDLSSRPVLFKLLAVLADRGGSASKEELVHEVWNEPEYHPLRHDPKLQTAVRKLRVQIERDAANPEHLLTSEEGYRLRLPIRRISRH